LRIKEHETRQTLQEHDDDDEEEEEEEEEEDDDDDDAFCIYHVLHEYG